MPSCKKCGNKTRDQRMGICDKCAFPKGVKGDKVADDKKKLDPKKKKKVKAAKKGVAAKLQNMLMNRGK